MSKLRCIIFDLDGTLTQTNELIFASFNHVADKYLHKQFTPNEIIGMFGPPEEIAIEKIVGSDRTPAAMEDFYRFYAEHHPQMAELHDGMCELLGFLKQNGMLIALFTGKGRRTTMITLEKLGIDHYFDLIVTGQDVERHKPSAEGILKVLEKFQLQREQVLMVGDAVADIKAATEAGVPAAAVLWDSYAKEKLETMQIPLRFDDVGQFSYWLRSAILNNGIKH